MRYTVNGADKDTGEAIEMTIDAASEAAAQDVANRRGIMVSRVAPALARQTPAPTVVVQPPQSREHLEQGHYAGAPVVNVALPRRGSSLGIASIVLGIMAFLICWIPFVNIIGIPLALLGLLLGLIGLLVAVTRKGSGLGFPIAGSAICALSLLVSISMMSAIFGGIQKAGDAIAAENQKRNATNQTTIAQKTPHDDGIAAPPPPSDAPTSDQVLSASSRSVAPNKPAPPKIDWSSAESPIKQGDVQLRVTSVRVGNVPLKELIGHDTTTSKDPLLQVAFEITNLSDTKKLNYRSWGGESSSFRSRMALTDNFENRYKHITFGFSTRVVGAVDSESIYPAKSLTDVIVFEEPIAKAEYLNLELSAEEFGGTGMIRIRIPASMIQR